MSNAAEALVKKTVNKALMDGDNERKKKIEEIYDYYDGNQKKYLKKNPNEDDARWAQRPKVSINYVGPIADRKSGMVYRGHIKRQFSGPATDLLTDVFSGADMFMQDVDLKAVLSGVALVRPYVYQDEDEGKREIKLRCYPGDVCTLMKDEKEGGIGLVHLAWGHSESWQTRCMYEQIWTKDYFYVRNGDQEQSGPNLYGFIPFLVVREAEDFFDPHGRLVMEQVVGLNHSINTVMTDLEWLIKMQAHGQMVASGVGKGFGFDVGPGTVALLPDKDSTLNLLSFDPKIQDCLLMHDRLRSAIFETSGIPEVAINPSGDISGISVLVQTGPLLDYRAEKLKRYAHYEKELAELIVRVANMEGLLKNVDYHKLEFAIDFDENPFPWLSTTTQDQELADLSNNVISLVDVVRRRNPDLDEVQAEEMLKRNQDLNSQYRSQSPAIPALPSFGGISFGQ